MTDIATLGIEVEAQSSITQVERYESALDDAVRTTERMEGKTRDLSRTMQTASRQTVEEARRAATDAVRVTAATFENDIARIREAQLRGYLSPREAGQQGRVAAQEYNAAVLRTLTEGRASGAFRGAAGQEAFTQVAGSLKNVEEGARRAHGGVGRLNNALITMARRATGTNVVVSQLVDVIGTFAIGTARMVPILAGLAAIGFAWQRATRDAREAREELERNLAVLDRIRERQDLEARGGETQVAVDAAREEARRVAAQLRTLVAVAGQGDRQRLGTLEARTRLTAELAELNERVRRGEEDLREERDRQNNRDLEDLNRRAEAASRAVSASIDDQRLAAETERTLNAITTEAELAGQAEIERAALERIARVFGFEIEAADRSAAEQRRIADESEAEKTRAAREGARQRAQAEVEEQRRIRLVAQGASILGRAVGGGAGGFLTGAAGGALAGSAFGAPGAVIGGIIGGIGSLLGASKDAKEAARLAREAAQEEARALAIRRRNIDDEIRIRGLALGGDSTGLQLAQLDARQRQELESRDLTPTQRETLEVLHELERAALERNLDAERQIRIAEEQLAVLDDQLVEQQRTVDTLRNVVSNLDQFGGSLSLGQFSPLSPAAQLEEARRQFGGLRSLALGGDVSAAESLPEAARRLLDASRAFNASGVGFVSDFNSVQQTIDLVRDRFADQLTVEEQMLAELEAQREALAAQIEEIRRQTEEANARAAEAFAQRQALDEAREERDRERRERELDDRLPDDLGDVIEDTIDRLGVEVRGGLEDVVTAVNRTTNAVERDNEERVIQ